MRVYVIATLIAFPLLGVILGLVGTPPLLALTLYALIILLIILRSRRPSHDH